jgi:hypothetical protein
LKLTGDLESAHGAHALYIDADLVRIDPLEIADYGLKFYTKFVKDAEKRFA